MGPVSVSAAVDAPRERVFDFISDLSNRPVFTDHFIDRFHLERVEPVGVGAGARFRVGAPGGIRYMDSTITEADRPQRIVERGHGGRRNRIAINTVWELIEGPGAVTTVTLTFWSEPKRRRGGRWWQRRWRKALRRLGGAIESGVESRDAVGVAGGNRQLTGIA